MNDIILYLLQDITKYIKDRSKRGSILLPFAQEYADTYEEMKFQKDVRDTLRFVYERSHTFSGNFSRVVAHMCVFEFSKAFDLGNAEHIFPKDSAVKEAVTSFLTTHTEQQIGAIVHRLLHRIDAETPYIVVQTPIPLDGPKKHLLRNELIDRYGWSFPHFAVNRELLGGLRMYVDGVTTEHTWQARLESILSDLYVQIT